MWKTAKLGDVIEKTETINPASKFPNESFEYIDVSSVNKERLAIEETQILLGEDAPSRARRRVHEDDVIFATVRPTLKRVAVVPKELDGQICSTGYIVLRSKRDVLLPRYLFHWMTSQWVMEYVESVQTGASYPAVTDKQVKEIDIQIPPLAEQQRIVAKLDAAFAEIDRAIEVESTKVASVQALVGAKLEALYNDEGYEELRLGDVCKFVGGSQPPKSTFQYEKTHDNIRLIQIRDYKSDKHLTYIPKEKAKRWCAATDVMIGRYGPPIFQILRGIEGAYNVALMKAVPADELDNDYLFYFLSNRRIQNYVINKSSRAAGQSGVNKDALEPYPIYLPPKELQLSIVRKTTLLIEQSQSLYRNCLKKLDAITLLKSAILAQELQPPQSEAA